MKSFILVALAVVALAKPVPQAGQDCPTDGQMICIGSDQFGLCANGRAIPQPVASGTECRDGSIVRAGEGGGDNGGNDEQQPEPEQPEEQQPEPEQPQEEQQPEPEQQPEQPPQEENTDGNNDDNNNDEPPPPPPEEENDNDNGGDGGDGLNEGLVPDFGVERGVLANDFGDCKGAVEGVLIPCDCPPSKSEFLDKLREFQANGNVTPIGETIIFPTGDNDADKLQRIEMSIKILQNFRGQPGSGCPAASTTLLKQAAALRG